MGYEIVVRSPEGEKITLLTTHDENYAKGAQAGVSSLLEFLKQDMEFEEGYQVLIEGSSAPFWSSMQPPAR